MTTEANPLPQNEIPFELDKMPEAVRTEPGLAKFKSVGDLAKSYVQLEQYLGAGKDNLFRVPKDGNLEAVWKHLGKPEKYEYPNDLKSPLPDDYKTRLADKANKLNLTDTQFKELLYFTDTEAQANAAATAESAKAARTAAEKALKDSMGDAYDQTMNFAKDVPEVFGKKGLWDKFDKAGLTTDPDFVSLMGQIGRMAGEEKLVNGQTGTRFGMTPAQAGAEIRRLQGDGNFVKQWTDKSNPGHKDAVARMTELHQIAHP